MADRRPETRPDHHPEPGAEPGREDRRLDIPDPWASPGREDRGPDAEAPEIPNYPETTHDSDRPGEPSGHDYDGGFDFDEREFEPDAPFRDPSSHDAGFDFDEREFEPNAPFREPSNFDDYDGGFEFDEREFEIDLRYDPRDILHNFHNAFSEAMEGRAPDGTQADMDSPIATVMRQFNDKWVHVNGHASREPNSIRSTQDLDMEFGKALSALKFKLDPADAARIQSDAKLVRELLSNYQEQRLQIADGKNAKLDHAAMLAVERLLIIADRGIDMAGDRWHNPDDAIHNGVAQLLGIVDRIRWDVHDLNASPRLTPAIWRLEHQALPRGSGYSGGTSGDMLEAQKQADHLGTWWDDAKTKLLKESMDKSFREDKMNDESKAIYKRMWPGDLKKMLDSWTAIMRSDKPVELKIKSTNEVANMIVAYGRVLDKGVQLTEKRKDPETGKDYTVAIDFPDQGTRSQLSGMLRAMVFEMARQLRLER